MMGDNRDNSTDSRVLSEVGYVPFENFVGRARSSSSPSTRMPSFWQSLGMAVDRALEPRCSSRSGEPRGRRRKLDPQALEERLGYAFGNRELLEHALTHVSAAAALHAESYQRLEFLGDRVLGLAIAELLYRELSHAPEGELVAAPVRARAPRDLRRGRARAGSSASSHSSAAARSVAAGGTEPADPRRCLRGGDRRRLHRRRLRGRGA